MKELFYVANDRGDILMEDLHKSFRNKFEYKTNEELRVYCLQYTQWRENGKILDNEFGEMVNFYCSIRNYTWKAVLVSDLLDVLEYRRLDDMIEIIYKRDPSKEGEDVQFGYSDYNYIQELLNIGYNPLRDLRDAFHTNNIGEVCALRVDYIKRTIDTAGNYKISKNDKLKPIEDVK